MAVKPSEFRAAALKLPAAVEGAHMGNADFRVGGKIFATLGYPDARFGVVMLSPADQDLLIKQYPKAFSPAAGAWGRAGSTHVRLSTLSRTAMHLALESAWTRRATKKLLATYRGESRPNAKPPSPRRAV